MMTAMGRWNAPIKFLPRGASIPVFPPIEESTIANSDVGRWT